MAASIRQGLDRVFRLAEHGTSVRTEVLGGLVTFLTMSYIVFLQPAILSGEMFGAPTGLDFGAAMTATCLASALATAIMALYARYPIAQAPGMGENFFFVLTVVPAASAAGFAEGWRVALGVVFIAGVLFLAISLSGLRRILFDAISTSMKSAMAAGIGFLIARLGLENGGLLATDPRPALNLDLSSPDLLIFLSGLLLTALLHARRVRAAILWGMVATTAAAVAFKLLLPEASESPAVADSMLATRFQIADRLVAAPPSLAPTLFKMDLGGALSLAMLPMILVFLVMDVLDTIGTLVGVSERAGFLVDNRLPRASRAMLSDAVGTTAGACLGTSTVTSFIESAAGVEQGARTGLAGLVTAALFLVALFFAPLVAMIGSYPPITAPALVVVGLLMARSLRRIDWSDPGEWLPAALTVVAIPVTGSIADGLTLGFIAYPLLKIVSGRGRQVHPAMAVLAVLLLLYFLLVRSELG